MHFKSFAALAVLILLLTACSAPPSPPAGEAPAASADDNTGSDEYAEFEDGELPLLDAAEVPVSVAEYATGFAFITDMVWAPDGRLFVAEKGGAVRVVSRRGEVQEEPVIVLPTNGEGEQGLLGIALDPDFARNGYIWAYHTWSDPEGTREKPWHRVVRFRERNGRGSDIELAWEIEDVFVESTILNGGAFGFGPDGMLYVSPGSGNNILSVNDPQSGYGKILRMTPTIPAEAPEDNPNAGSMVYASGFRNPYKLTFHPETGVMYATENGPDCDDEINRVLPGGHYGWRIDGLCEDNRRLPEYSTELGAQFVAPLLYFTPTVSPTGITFYQGDVFPEWQNTLFWCTYKDGQINYATLGEDGFTILTAGLVGTGAKNCATTIISGPDGLLYFSDITSVNRIERAAEAE